jgi:transposase
MDYQGIRDKIDEGKKIVEKYKDETPKAVLEVCYSMFDINSLLVDKLEELDNKISKNSRNSSKPPSTDKEKEIKPNQSLRGSSGKKPGGQKGRKGSGLNRVENPDERIIHVPEGKCLCGLDLSLLNLSMHSNRQVFEIEFLKKAIEHQVLSGVCNCGQKHCGIYPTDIKATTQYGQSVRALASYLSKYQLIPFDRLREMMSDLFGYNVSEGSLANFSKYAESSLEGFKEKFFEHVNCLKFGHVDETTTRVNGKRGHLHVFSNAYLSFIYYHKKRGMKAVDDCGLLTKFNGTLIHDCFSMYFNYGRSHAICNAHLLRELTFIEEKYQHRWAHKVKTYLFDLNELVKMDRTSHENILDYKLKDELRYDFHKLLNEGRIECAPLIKAVKNRGKRRGKQHPALNLLNRMLKLRDNILRFLDDYDIPFTNNQAERDLRMTKVHLKISGGFRSEGGAQNYALFRSYISSVKKHGISVFEALKNLYNFSDNPTLDLIFKAYSPS